MNETKLPLPHQWSVNQMPGNQHHIPEVAKEQWVKMSAHLSLREIVKVTGASQQTVNHVLRLSCLTGSVVKKPLEGGHPCSLTANDVCVSCLLPL